VCVCVCVCVVLEAVVDGMQANLGHMSPRHISSTFCALTALKFKPSSAVWQLMTERALECCPKFSAASTVDMFCACAKNRAMHVPTDERLVKALTERALALEHELTPGHVTSVIWALAQLREEPSHALLSAFSQCVSSMALSLTPWHISTILWALAMLGIEADAALLEALEAATQRTVEQFTAQDMANTLWALGILLPHASRSATALANSLAEKALAIAASVQYSDEQLRSLHEWFITCQVQETVARNLSPAAAALRSKLGALCRAKFEASAALCRSHLTRHRALLMEVSGSLRHLGLCVEVQVSCVQSGLILDILARFKGEDGTGWVLDVEGPKHTLNCQVSLRGPVITKRRQIQALGYSLVVVPGHEWSRLQGHDERLNYLRLKMHIPLRPLVAALPGRMWHVVEARLEELFASSQLSRKDIDELCRAQLQSMPEAVAIEVSESVSRTEGGRETEQWSRRMRVYARDGTEKRWAAEARERKSREVARECGRAGCVTWHDMVSEFVTWNGV